MQKKEESNNKIAEDAPEQETLEAENNENELKEKVLELTNDLQRTRADFENYRKQIDLQKAQEKKTAQLATVLKILPLLDDIDRAIASYEELKPLQGSLAKTLKALQLEKIVIDEKTEFNPELHEAVMSEGDGEKEKIAEVLRAGYYYEGEVLRPAMVKVEKVTE